MRQDKKEFALSSLFLGDNTTVRRKCHIAVSTVSDEAKEKGEYYCGCNDYRCRLHEVRLSLEFPGEINASFL